MDKEIYDKCAALSADGIYRYLRTEKSEINSGYNCSLCDAAVLFTAIAYINEQPRGSAAKEALRKEAYLAFLSGSQRERFAESYGHLSLLTGNGYSSGLKVRILKGGSYKIKDYYLENDLLCDIRGASVLLSHIEENVIPHIISERFIRECIVYSGGGNIFAILPENCEERFALELEAKAAELLVSADIAYHISEAIPASDIFGENYRSAMAGIENALSDRRKLKFAAVPDAVTQERIIDFPAEGGEGFFAKIKPVPAEKPSVCSACGKRTGLYTEGGKCVCASCLHKRSVGAAAKNGKYSSLYSRYNGGRKAVSADTLDDICISSGSKYIAVVYGDGNNMGGIIGGFTSITQMMGFSRDVKNATEKAAFEAMGENGIDRFEVAGLGGDDIFVIVDGKRALKFTIAMIKKYSAHLKKYEKNGAAPSMSAGIAIAGADIPVRIMLERAEEELDRAKALPSEGGSLSFSVIGSYESITAAQEGEISDTLFPCTLAQTEQLIDFADRLKNDGLISMTALRNILNAFSTAKSPADANIFLDNFNEKNSGIITIPPLEGYEIKGGYYIKDGRYCYLWKDILTLTEFSEGGGADD